MNASERLTSRNPNGDAIIRMDGVENAEQAQQRIRNFSPLIISRLTAYEDTGLSPEEIQELKRLYLCNECGR